MIVSVVIDVLYYFEAIDYGKNPFFKVGKVFYIGLELHCLSSCLRLPI